MIVPDPSRAFHPWLAHAAEADRGLAVHGLADEL
jgi:hypothetical protein